MSGPGSSVSSNCKFLPIPISRAGSTPTHLITTAAALRLGSFLRRRIHLRLFFPSSPVETISHLGHAPYLRDIWQRRAFQHIDFTILQWPYDAISNTCLSLFFFKGNGNENDSDDVRKAYSKTSRRVLSDGRKWTNILLTVNILLFVAQTATHGKLLFWGAKINSLIDKGQIWRLATSSLLHANVGHLLVNCYSLNSVGPAVEKISGPRRFLAIYITSAIASSAMSYCLCKAPAVGASGAIFGLVGSFAVFVLRHRRMVKGSEHDLQHIVRVIALNMVIGVLSRGIDNWGHLGGLIGGAATSWLLGPAWKLESISGDGHKVFIDRAPIFSIIRSTRKIQ